MTPASAKPRQIDLQRSRQLMIVWLDDHESTYPLPLLRRNCPCATCRAEREEREKNPLTLMPGAASQADMVVAESADLIGNYALRIRWKDGHDTGMFDFELLRGMCPCASCAGTVRS